ncbi:MAG: YlxM family DNA-binding protein [Clostridia bacterium]|nr:YlxM family DNA-binding protein [Clostridia bacterium]
MAQEEVEKKIELSWLMDFYGGLLTDKQQEVLRLHCEEDLSMGEIAQEAGISRQGVHDMLTRTAQKLFDYERKLGMATRFARMEEGLTRCREALGEKRYDDAAALIDALIRFDREDNNGI